ncbi:MAG TPA: carboxypeptidase-like regulatory domain-containing protein [Thermoanaerobaculia bacterium]
MKNSTRKSPLLRLLAWAFLTLALLPGASPAAAAPYAQGDRVQITGIVSDPQGQPLANVRVVLEASRSYFSIRQLRRTQADDVRRVSTTTNAQGEYTLEWPWDSYFNHFELAAGVPVRKGRADSLEELERTDVTRRVMAGSPVVTSVVVQNAEHFRRLREFLASVKSDDERKVYDDMGRPDKVERVQYPGSQEVSWWYFDAGRVYRFRDGRLQQVVPFDPVKG